MTLLMNTNAIGFNNTTKVSGTGGTAPYVYSVAPGGVGGSINPSTGVYTSPNAIGVDVIIATDALLATAQGSIKVLTPLMLFCDVLEHELDLVNGRVYLWDQKITEPKDIGIFIAVGVLNCKPFSNIIRLNSAGDAEQTTNFFAALSIDIISRGPEARDRKEEVVLALNSFYAQAQQEQNGFYIAKLSSSFQNLSEQDGAAIPYRFNITVNMQYAVSKVKATGYFDTFQSAQVNTDF